MRKMVNKTTNNYILSISEVQRFTKALVEVLDKKQSKTIGNRKTGITHRFEYNRGISGKSDYIRITRTIDISSKPKKSSKMNVDKDIQDLRNLLSKLEKLL